MQLQEYMTLKELEEKYEISTATIRAYISRKKVIPEQELFKLGNQWLIRREFAEEKWGKKEK